MLNAKNDDREHPVFVRPTIGWLSYPVFKVRNSGEEAFLIVKRLLNLSYLWTGSVNGVLLQVWSTWLFFAVLVDLGDAVAEELRLPFDRISLEMVFRGLYHFIQAYNKGEATDPLKYLAAPENQDLGVVKRLRKKPVQVSTDALLSSVGA
jgi:hypothetical protein